MLSYSFVKDLIGANFINPYGAEFDFSKPACFVKVSGGDKINGFARESTIGIEYLYTTEEELQNLRTIVEQKIKSGPVTADLYFYKVVIKDGESEMLSNGFNSLEVEYTIWYEEV